MPDLHRHDHFSSFDGFGKANELAKIAKDLGYTALGIANHGNTNGLIQHYFACKEAEIKPIMGVEAYFQPSINKEKPRYHLCLFAKNLKGYENINRMMFIGEQQKYYNPIITLKELREYSEGVICTSACVAGYISQAVAKGNVSMADKMIKEFKDIFEEDYYIEIQPYKISDEGVQERINIDLMDLAEANGVECILTSDSHYGKKEDFSTYVKMHEIAKHKMDFIEETYGERYMPSYDEMVERFVKMHGEDLGVKRAKSRANRMIKNLKAIEDKVEGEILEKLPLELPEFIEGKDSYELLEKNVIEGLKRRGKFKKKYIQRCKEELEIIKYHGFADYFLVVADYVNWAKDQGITVGPGRGSVCNCQVAYALRITEVDSLRFGLDFRRFLRKDKAKLPDIDLDFETSRRAEVIEYLINKYKGHAAQICSYGLYKVDNLLNDLVKVCGCEDKAEIKAIKDFTNKFIVDGKLELDRMMGRREAREYNKKYDNILYHFNKLFQKVRYIGTHAAGVAITGGKLLNYAGLRVSKEGKIFTNYDLSDLEYINVIKFDILGLKTMESIGELRRITGVGEFDDAYLDDPKLNEEFGKGETDGIFQFEKKVAREILVNIKADCFEDVVAASSMNRPGPLSLGMPQQYAENKFNLHEAQSSKYYEYTKETYGTIVYQEQLQRICVEIGQMSWKDSDRVMKILKRSGEAILTGAYANVGGEKEELIEMFVEGATKNGYTKSEATELFEKLLVYSFNKGHGVGYSMISAEEMYYKIYHPAEYWYCKIKYARDSSEIFKFVMGAVKNEIVTFLPHVNYTGDCSIRKVDGEKVIQLGLSTIKGVGAKAATLIEEERRANGFFKSLEDFETRCKGRIVTKGVVSKLLEEGALEFNKKVYLGRVIKYNSSILARV